MFRSAPDALAVLAKLKARGVSLHMIDLGGDVTSNGISKLVFTIPSAVAEAEPVRIRERVGQVKADQKVLGQYQGGKIPFGFAVGENKALVPVPEEQEAILTAHRLRNEGQTIRSIQATLAASGHDLSLAALHRVLNAKQAA